MIDRLVYIKELVEWIIAYTMAAIVMLFCFLGPMVCAGVLGSLF